MTKIERPTLELLGKQLVEAGFYQVSEWLWKKHNSRVKAWVSAYADNSYSNRLKGCRPVCGYIASFYGDVPANVPDGKRGV